MTPVSAQDAKQFGKVWTHNGVAIVLQDVHLQFAADFANIVLKSFVENAQRAAAARQAAAAKPLVSVEG